MSNRHLLAAAAVAALLPVGTMAQTFGSGTWYGSRGLSAHTASGDRFNEEAMTAASNRFPMGTTVRVTLQDTGASVIVRINDRIGGRGTLIDLTKGAARQIGLLGRGRGDVMVETTDQVPTEVAEATEDEVADIDGMAPPVRRRARWTAPVRGGYRQIAAVIGHRMARHSL